MIRVRIDENDVLDTQGMMTAFPGVKKSTLAREVALGRLKCYRRGRVTFFLGVDVLEWIRAGKVEPTQVDIEADEPDEV